MIPERILSYLSGRGITYERLTHPPVLTAQELAAVLHVTGHRVAKSVLLEAESERYMAVLPACERIDERRVADVLQARSIRLLTEGEFAQLFPDCELGAEPPFGKLYDLPVILDESLADRSESITFRAGSHTEAIRMRYIDYERIERPIVAGITMSIAPYLSEEARERHLQV